MRRSRPILKRAKRTKENDVSEVIVIEPSTSDDDSPQPSNVSNSAADSESDDEPKTSETSNNSKSDNAAAAAAAAASEDDDEDEEREREELRSEKHRKKKKKKKKKVAAADEGENLLHKFPMNRINRIVRSADGDELRLTHEAVFLINKASEKFLDLFCEEAYACSVQDHKNYIAYKNLSSIVCKHRRFDFLSDFIPEKLKAEDALEERKSAGS